MKKEKNSQIDLCEEINGELRPFKNRLETIKYKNINEMRISLQ